MTDNDINLALDEQSQHFTRSLAVATDKKLVVYGYAIVYNSPSVDLGGYREVIARDAFTDDIKTRRNITCLYEHEGHNVLGETAKGTLVLTPDDKGVAFELTLPDTEFGNSVYQRAQSGELDGMSFGFKQRLVEWDLDRSIKTVRLGVITEVTITSTPAYEATVALTRSKSKTQKKEPEPETQKSKAAIDMNKHRLRMLM